MFWIRVFFPDPDPEQPFSESGSGSAKNSDPIQIREKNILRL